MDESTELKSDVTSVGDQFGHRRAQHGSGHSIGIEQCLDHTRNRRRCLTAGSVERHLECCSFPWSDGPARARSEQRLEELELAGAGVISVGEVERIETNRSPGLERQGRMADRGGQCSVFPLRVEDESLATEGQLPQEIGLDQCALAATDLPEHDRIGVREDPGSIELEGVVGEQAS